MGDASRELLEIRVLGPFGVTKDGRRIDLTSGRLRVLVAVLAMSAGRPVSVERLTDAVWGEDPPASGRRTLQTYVTRLRTALGPEAIVTEPAGYVLRTSPDDVDALRFLRLLDRAPTEPDAERAQLAEALGLWRGSPFEGLESRWLHESEASRLKERWLAATERRVDLDLADGRAVEWVAMLRELASHHPLREPLWVRFLLALAGSGRQSEALEQYEVIRSRIADELGVDPGAELQRIHADLLAGVEPAPSGGARPEPMIPRQLPVDIGGFVGRERAMATLDEIVIDAAGQPVMMAVHGTGGVGKTSLVVHWAHRVAERFPDGQLYVNLRGYGPGAPMAPAVALDTLLRGLGVAGERIPTEVEARESLFRSMLAERQLLLILDNARDSEQVRPLLPGSGRTAVVITSRSQLRGLVAREGAHRLGLDQLDPDESEALLATALAARAVRHDAGGLGELANLCGHLPLALSVAAERASREPDAGIFELVDELRAERERLDALDVGDESTDVRAVFAWSYRALDADTARMFRLLGLHPGPDLSRPSAAALANITGSEARHQLDRLVDGSLLQLRRGGRYELHDLLRTYAAELVEDTDPKADRDAARDRLLEWYFHAAANGRRALSPSPLSVDIGDPPSDLDLPSFEDHRQALAWFDAERDALLAVVDTLIGLARHRRTYEFVSMIWQDFQRARAFDDLLRLGSAALQAAQATGDDLAEAHSANRLGVVYGERMEFGPANDLLHRALDRCARLGDSRTHARVLDNLGVVQDHLGRIDEAVDFHERSIAMIRRMGDVGDEVNALNNLAAAYIKLERFADAARLAEETAELCRQRGDSLREASVLDTLGQARAAQGRHEQAIASYRRAVQLFDEHHDLWFKGVALTNLGRTLRASGDADSARSAWAQALETFDLVGSPDRLRSVRAEVVELLASTAAGD